MFHLAEKIARLLGGRVRQLGVDECDVEGDDAFTIFEPLVEKLFLDIGHASSW